MKSILRIGKGVKGRRARVKEICELPKTPDTVDRLNPKASGTPSALSS